MGRFFGLAAYRALSRRSANPEYTPSGPRPKGELVWVHASEPGNFLAVQDLAERLKATRRGLSVLITVPSETQHRAALDLGALPQSVMLDMIPSEHPQAVTTFLEHWLPDMCIWTWGRLRPNLVAQTTETGCAMVLVDGDTDGFDGRRDRWLPELSRSLLADFAAVMVRSSAGLQRLVALGLTTDTIDVTPPLQAGGQALPCADSDIAELSGMLGGRPVWLAAGVQQEEIMTVLTAHRQALRLSHRLLLVLNPADAQQAKSVIERVAADEFRLCVWSDGGIPDDSTQVLVAEDARDLGLFYRIAPVSFLGSSLSSGHGGRNPFEAATLGSAVLYGPNVRRFLPFYTRLANAGAARIVNDAQTLGTAVTRLISPDQAAAMAHAGWDVISEGAEVADRVVALVKKVLNAKGNAPHART